MKTKKINFISQSKCISIDYLLFNQKSFFFFHNNSNNNNIFCCFGLKWNEISVQSCRHDRILRINSILLNQRRLILIENLITVIWNLRRVKDSRIQCHNDEFDFPWAFWNVKFNSIQCNWNSILSNEILKYINNIHNDKWEKCLLHELCVIDD